MTRRKMSPVVPTESGPWPAHLMTQVISLTLSWPSGAKVMYVDLPHGDPPPGVEAGSRLSAGGGHPKGLVLRRLERKVYSGHEEGRPWCCGGSVDQWRSLIEQESEDKLSWASTMWTNSLEMEAVLKFYRYSRQ